jgi:hypothetical protein
MTEYTRVVTTQAQLDQALADGVPDVQIRSERGVWITVEAFGSATVEAFDSATVRAFDSATVRAFGSATVEAFGSATVEAFDSATVRASGSATVEAFDSATVRAFDSATVRAFGSATVEAFDSATVRASSHVAVHLHSGRARIEGGVVIDHLSVDQTDPASWCAYHGVTVLEGVATVYKAVNDSWTTPRGVDYAPGSSPASDDWSPVGECGGGLHFGPTPGHAAAYYDEATRYVAVGVELATLVPITGSGTAKCKAPRVVRPCVEVDVMGREVARPESGTGTPLPATGGRVA